MDDNDLTTTKKQSDITVSNGYTKTRAKSFKVTTGSNFDYDQYKRTIDAYMQAGLPFEHIADAGDIRGDTVERNEVNAPLQEGWQGKVGEMASDDNKTIAWQSRGERISQTHQLTSSAPTKGTELITTSQQLTVSDSTGNKTIEVVEGIAVIKEEILELPDKTSDKSHIQNNPFLTAIPEEIEKAS